jgi:probable addiction module antidote protein
MNNGDEDGTLWRCREPGDPEEIAAYPESCIHESDGDGSFIATALGDIARVKWMTQVARKAGLSRERLFKAHSGDWTQFLTPC